MWADGLIYATIRRYTSAESEIKFRRPEHSFNITLGGASDWTRAKVSGSPIYEGRLRPGGVTYAPADIERLSWHRNFNLDGLHLLIDPGYLRSCELSMDPLDIPSFINAYDPLLLSILWSLAREMREDAKALPSIYVEHATGLLMAHLIHSLRRGRSGHPSRGGLSEITLRRVIDFIEANLSEDISLTALGALAGTGADAFARNFRASMGMPPYRYVMEQRMQRAQALLAANDKSIAQIAFEVGFPTQAHFTTQFGKFMKMSPAAYRALHRG
jgi:AraC family transcriptional regulator